MLSKIELHNVLNLLDRDPNYKYLVNCKFHSNPMLGETEFFTDNADREKKIGIWLENYPANTPTGLLANHVISNMTAVIAIDLAISKWKQEKVNFQFDWSTDMIIKLAGYFFISDHSADAMYTITLDNSKQFACILIIIDTQPNLSIDNKFLDRTITLKGTNLSSQKIIKTLQLEDLTLQILKEFIAECGKP